MPSRDVFVVLVHDPSGAVIVDSIHHQAVGRGSTYSKVGALNRASELERRCIRVDVKRVKTGEQLPESYSIKKF